MSVLVSNGFRRRKARSGHAVYKHPDGRKVEVPIHGSRDISRSLFKKMLRASMKKLEEFL